MRISAARQDVTEIRVVGFLPGHGSAWLTAQAPPQAPVGPPERAYGEEDLLASSLLLVTPSSTSFQSVVLGHRLGWSVGVRERGKAQKQPSCPALLLCEQLLPRVGSQGRPRGSRARIPPAAHLFLWWVHQDDPESQKQATEPRRADRLSRKHSTLRPRLGR